MRTEFEINGDFRLMDSAELVYILTNKTESSDGKKMIKSLPEDNIDFNEVLYQLTPKKKRMLMAGIELYKRCISKKNSRPQIRCSKDIYEIMYPYMGDNRTEECWALFLNHSNRVIRKIRISVGGYTLCPVDIRVILKEALMYEATGIILCHNHPSGSCRPSTSDDHLTRAISNATKVMDINFLDHLIICGESYYSYADSGRI